MLTYRIAGLFLMRIATHGPLADLVCKHSRLLIESCITARNFGLIKNVSDRALSLSDHAAVIGSFKLKELTMRPALISRLDPRILQDPETVRLLDDTFGELFAQRSKNWNPHVSLEYMKMCIRTASSTAAGKIKARYRDEEATLNGDINLVINELSLEPPNEVKLLLMHKLDDLRQLKRTMVAKIGAKLEARTARKWYNEGELSNKYFFNLLSWRSNDEISVLLNDQGNEVSESVEIKTVIADFYKNLYESVPEDLVTTDDLLRNIEPIRPEVAAPVSAGITLGELEATLKTCDDSAPGPDGIQYSFLKHFWTDVGPIILDAWHHSLEQKELPPSHKVSYLRLIPKAGKDTRLISNLRPITLSNTDHKLITKTYAKKLTEAAASQVGEEQTAYIPGRLINDNIRSILMMMDLAEIDREVDGVVVLLDAKKATDTQ